MPCPCNAGHLTCIISLSLTAVLWGEDYFYSLLKRNQSLQRSEYLALVPQEMVAVTIGSQWSRNPVSLAFCHSASHTGPRVTMRLFWLEADGARLIKVVMFFPTLFDSLFLYRIYFYTTCFQELSQVFILSGSWVLRGLLMQSKPSLWMSLYLFRMSFLNLNRQWRHHRIC